MATEKLRYVVSADTKGFKDIAKFGKIAAGVVVAGFAAAIKITAEFEKELSKLRAVSGATEKEMVQLEKKSRALGKSTAFTATQVAKLQVELAKLGFTTNDILNASGGVLDLAAGLGVELKDAAVLTGSTLRAFGLTTEETGRVVDVLAKSASSSALDFTSLTESLKLAAPIARSTNKSIEETVALLGTLANAGVKGSIAGTALRKIFIELNAKGLTLNDAFDQITNSSDKLGTAVDIAGKRAGGALLILADGVEPTKELAVELDNAAGSAEKMRNIMEDNLINDFLKLTSAVTDLGISLGKTTDGPLRDFVKYLTDLINGTDEELPLLTKLDVMFKNFALQVFKGALAIQEFRVAFNDMFKFPNEDAKAAVKRLEDIIRLQKGVIRSAVGSHFDEIDNPTPGSTPAPAAATKSRPKVQSVSGSISSGLTDLGIEVTTAEVKDLSEAFQMMVREGDIKAFLTELKEIEAVTELVSDSFDKLGASITDALTNSMGVAGAFFGTMIQGLLDLAQQAITSVLITQATEGTKQAAYGATAVAAGVAGAAAGAAAGGPAAPVLLPIFIAAALAAIGAALAGTKGKSKVSGGGGGSRSPSTATTTTPQSVQGFGGGGQLVATVRGQDLRFVLQGANDSYQAIN